MTDAQNQRRTVFRVDERQARGDPARPRSRPRTDESHRRRHQGCLQQVLTPDEMAKLKEAQGDARPRTCPDATDKR